MNDMAGREAALSFSGEDMTKAAAEEAGFLQASQGYCLLA